MPWPIYFKDQLIIGDPKNSVGVCTLWTMKEIIAKNLPRNSFSVCGQLYSKEGIKYIIRNILANPRIFYLIICGSDQSLSGQTLKETIEKSQWRGLEKEIPQKFLNLFQDNVKIIDLRGDIDPVKIQKAIDALQKKLGQWLEPKIFPEKAISRQGILPTDPSFFKLRHPTVASSWPWILKHIMRFGVEKETDYGVRQKEIINLAVVIYDEDPWNIKFVDHFDFTSDDFERYAPQILEPNPLPGIQYTYGERLRNYLGIDQIYEGIINELKRAHHSRRAVACIWHVPEDIKSKQPPCINLIQGLVQNGKLHLSVYIRSNDMLKAWPQDALALRRLQGLIAREVKLDIGTITTISSSAHIYEPDFEKANEIIAKHANDLRCEWDPRGNFVIGLDKKSAEIIASHYSPDGEKIGEYRGKSSQELRDQIDKDLTISQISHALYLGEELHKAEMALKLGKGYNQDRPL